MKDDTQDYLFDKRNGFEPTNMPFQIDNIDWQLRIDLWNAFFVIIYKQIDSVEPYKTGPYIKFHQLIWARYLRKPLDDFPEEDEDFKLIIRKYIENQKWFKVYSFFEFVLRNASEDNTYDIESLKDLINEALRENNSGYSLLETNFIPIINENELEELINLKKSTNNSRLKLIENHLDASIEMISKKPKPDCRNSIKESISMVEAVSRMIEPSTQTLGKALSKLEQNQKISPELKAGFEKLYAFTNGKNGIRHALMDDESIEIEDARFFLISCSAFTNYLIQKASRSGITF
ncbi:hypothetical protein RT717_06125 [Imperialibacter roseus]|uniref:HEPN AbiJ-N-terminal domain-containing protein n=1 Tax=Imperialibacter roseus TaxID=1324217 RepID=A0ABZ0IX37_9BACT|nr:hypothetical protein [Imperialibacter roseus]WOK08211.1 hypothetical protein RT717_06125 [Imperialibacter roseus]